MNSVDFFYRIEHEEEDVSGVKFGASNECELCQKSGITYIQHYRQ